MVARTNNELIAFLFRVLKYVRYHVPHLCSFCSLVGIESEGNDGFIEFEGRLSQASTSPSPICFLWFRSISVCPWPAAFTIMETQLSSLCQTSRKELKQLIYKTTPVCSFYPNDFKCDHIWEKGSWSWSLQTRRIRWEGNEMGSSWTEKKKKIPVTLSVLFTVLYICMNRNTMD